MSGLKNGFLLSTMPETQGSEWNHPVYIAEMVKILLKSHKLTAPTGTSRLLTCCWWLHSSFGTSWALKAESLYSTVDLCSFSSVCLCIQTHPGAPALLQFPPVPLPTQTSDSDYSTALTQLTWFSTIKWFGTTDIICSSTLRVNWKTHQHTHTHTSVMHPHARAFSYHSCAPHFQTGPSSCPSPPSISSPLEQNSHGCVHRWLARTWTLWATAESLVFFIVSPLGRKVSLWQLGFPQPIPLSFTYIKADFIPPKTTSRQPNCHLYNRGELRWKKSSEWAYRTQTTV